METRANYVLIGVFVLAVVAGVFGFVWWFQNTGGGGERAYFRVIFESSVSGLRTGASVLFNGIRVGEVNELRLSPDKPSQVVAYISVDKGVAVREDTRVAIEFQGLTGIAAIGLSGGTSSKPPLTGTKDNPATISGNQANTQDVTQGARELLRRLDEFVAANQQSFGNSLKNIETFTDALAGGSDQINSTLKNLDLFSQSLARNADKIDRIATNLENLTGGADGKSGELVATARSIRDLAENLDKRVDEVSKGINAFTTAGTRQINDVGRDARGAIATIDRAVKNIDQNPSRLLFGGSSSKSR